MIARSEGNWEVTTNLNNECSPSQKRGGGGGGKKLGARSYNWGGWGQLAGEMVCDKTQTRGKVASKTTPLQGKKKSKTTNKWGKRKSARAGGTLKGVQKKGDHE